VNKRTTKTQRNKETRKNLFIWCFFVPLCLCGFSSCAGSKVGTDSARKVIAQDLSVPEKRVQVWNVSQLGETVLAEGALRVTFVLQKDSSRKWRLLKMKYSDEWETPEKFLSLQERSSLSTSLQSAFLRELTTEP
jgi:hypothetical protein